jgi:hypothetical protein
VCGIWKAPIPDKDQLLSSQKSSGDRKANKQAFDVKSPLKGDTSTDPKGTNPDNNDPNPLLDPHAAPNVFGLKR